MAVRRLYVVGSKLSWGLRAVGPFAMAAGLARFIKIWLMRPARSQVRLRSGPILEFDYPGQFPSTLVLFGDFIDPEFPFLQLLAKPHWQVVDVGAAIGQFSMFAAMCLPHARVNAFEPSGVNIATLSRNIERNGVEEQVAVHQMALSNRRDMARFATAPKTWMSQLLDAGSNSADSELVAVDTLDAVADTMRLGHIHLLKINVAGFEPQVLEGAMATLRAGRVDVMVLLLGLASLPHYAAIAELGYRFFYYHPRQRSLFEVTRFDEDSVLAHRPWPARHILAVRSAVVGDLVEDVMPIRPLETG